MRLIPKERGRLIEAMVYPLLLLSVLWIVFIVDKYFQMDLYRYGVKPRTLEGLKGILFMPFIHGQKDYSHIINNSAPIFALLGTLIYFYREIAFQVFLWVWFAGGLLLWAFAVNTHSYHIGMSGVIYGLFGFLLLSGFIRKYLPLQAISLIVAFVYGSMVWGIFPTEERISWEGHFSGLLIGIILAVFFRKEGPVSPKYRYEIEQEMGIKPPDFEGEWKKNQQAWEENQMRLKEELTQRQQVQQTQEAQENEPRSEDNVSISQNAKIEYHYRPDQKKK